MPSVAVDEFFSSPFSFLDGEFSVVLGGGVELGCGWGFRSFSLLGVRKENISENFDSSFINLRVSSEFFKLLKSGLIASGKSGCCER